MFDAASLAAVGAVVRTGSFEKAARQLHVTPSAISQRVKNLEDRLGAVLIVRGQPCTATATGMRLCRHADEVGLLEHRLLEDLEKIKPDTRPLTIRIAVNADSLATWFVAAMAATRGVLFDLVLDDQDHSAEWLRRGEVSAAVTATLAAPQGCAFALRCPLALDRCRADPPAVALPNGHVVHCVRVTPEGQLI